MPDRLQSVFEPRFLRKLDRLRVTIRHGLSTRPGNTPMPHGSQPAGMELTSYQAYAPGDDLRHLDWNVYGRLDHMLVKRFRAEREAPLHIFIDSSASMGFPERDNKLSFASSLAAAFAYIALRHQDPTRIVVLGGEERPHRCTPFLRHVQRLVELQQFLASLQARGHTALEAGIASYLRASATTGIAIILSDFLVHPNAYESPLERLQARGFSVAALRVIGSNERNPRLPAGRVVRLRDAETGREREVWLTSAHRARYADTVRRHLARLEQWCKRHEVVYATIESDGDIEHCLFEELPRSGLLH